MNNATACLEVLPGVKVWSGMSKTGTSLTVSQGSYNHLTLGSLNNNVESLLVSPGMLVRACDTSGYPGTTGSGACLTYINYVSTLGFYNNKFSNLEVSAGLWAYPNEEYGGTPVGFAPGVYKTAQLAATTVGNDNIGSIVIGPGMKATLCELDGGVGGVEGYGACKTYTGWNSQLGFLGTDANRINMNDKTSYIHLRPIEDP